MLDVEQLSKNQQQQPDGRWIPARPIQGPWRARLRDAMAVFRGEAEAVRWPEGGR